MNGYCEEDIDVGHYGPFAAFHSRGTKPPCWDAKVALWQDQQKAYIILRRNPSGN